MTYTTWKVEHTPFINDNWDSDDTVELTSYRDTILNMSLGDGRDSFSLKTTNFAGNKDGQFNANDKITIYRTTNSDITTTDDILMVGTLKSNPTTISSTTSEIRLDGYNYSEVVMDSIVFIDPKGKTIPETIQLALENASGQNQNFSVQWDSGNPSVKQDGTTSFPVVYERFYYKTVRSIIEKYSRNLETEDGNYFWYVNKENKLIWRPFNSSTAHTFNSSTDTYKNLKFANDNKDVINFIVIKGGRDPAGNQIQTYAVDYSSINKNGRKFKLIFSEANSAEELMRQDNGGGETGIVRYPDLSTTFTTTWEASYTATVEGISVVKNSRTTITGSSEDDRKSKYTAVLRKEIFTRIQKEGQDWINKFKNGVIKSDIEFRAGAVNWGLGDRVTTTIKQLRSEPVDMRVTDIQYTTSLDTYSLEEDRTE